MGHEQTSMVAVLVAPYCEEVGSTNYPQGDAHSANYLCSKLCLLMELHCKS